VGCFFGVLRLMTFVIGMLRYFFISLVVAGVSPKGAVTLELSAVTGKTLAELERVVGPSSGVDVHLEAGQVCRCERLLFLEGKLAVVFVGGKSDWLWVYEGITLTGIEKARIKAFLKFGRYTLIKTETVTNTVCCEGWSLNWRFRYPRPLLFAQV